MFIKTSFAQHNKGTYTGSHGNGKMVAFINDTDGIFIGYFYETRNTHHILIGTSLNNEVKGQIKLAGLKEYDCEGIFRNDSLIIFVNEINAEHFMKIALKKENKNPKVNLDKYFSNEKPTHDPKLVGEWEVFSNYDLKKQQYRKDKDYNSVVHSKDGSFSFVGGKATSTDLSKITMSWYVQGSNLILNFETKYGAREFNSGQYSFSGDTLITSGERYISKYLKKK
ncbi:hypothetical protein GCM10011514_09040 [Emticicia aquatilis]|uniref:Lipocalin-like domain-containing protein n=1 Tax=Emticicia aquatilis TaxID=1537369 RepID=A0A916YIH9_9BACT|nr:hypothetical protein GCM10011514_09040 [Emticicia aquatilis]